MRGKGHTIFGHKQFDAQGWTVDFLVFQVTFTPYLGSRIVVRLFRCQRLPNQRRSSEKTIGVKSKDVSRNPRFQSGFVNANATSGNPYWRRQSRWMALLVVCCTCTVPMSIERKTAAGMCGSQFQFRFHGQFMKSGVWFRAV